MSRFPTLSTPFVSSRDVDVITVSDDVPRRYHREKRGGVISLASRRFFFCLSAITTLPFKTRPLCARLLRTRISRVEVHEGAPLLHDSFFLSQRFFLNFVRYPLSYALLRPFLISRFVIAAKIQTRVTGNEAASPREKSRVDVKNRKLRDRLGRLFYAL